MGYIEWTIQILIKAFYSILFCEHLCSLRIEAPLYGALCDDWGLIADTAFVSAVIQGHAARGTARGGGFGGRAGCSDADNIFPRRSPDSITRAVCVHELITGTLEALAGTGAVTTTLMEV